MGLGVQTMNEKNLQKIDYLLALIPVLIFIIPIAYFIRFIVTPLDLDIVYFLVAIIIVSVLFSLIWYIWTWKLTIKDKPFRKNIRKAFWLSFIDLIVLMFILVQLTILDYLVGSYQVIWGIFTGFISIVLVTILADLHKLPEVYTYSMEWIKKKIY